MFFILTVVWCGVSFYVGLVFLLVFVLAGVGVVLVLMLGSVVWCGVVWCGVVWCGVQCGVM